MVKVTVNAAKVNTVSKKCYTTVTSNVCGECRRGMIVSGSL